jgi:predicted nucleic acid-binding protein
MIILDTNVLSELMRQTPAPQVLAWLRHQPMTELGTTTINIAEVKYGLARLPAGRRRRELEKRFFGFVSRGLGGRILDFDHAAADFYPDIIVVREKAGRRLQGSDGLILAAAKSRGAGIATRNTADFEGCGVSLINPWISNKT